MFLYIFLLSLIFQVPSAIIFDGPCPDVLHNETTDPTLIKYNVGHLLFSTKIESKINHVFYSAFPKLQYLTLTLLLIENYFDVSKTNHVPTNCNRSEVLVPSDENGYYRHEIRQSIRPIGTKVAFKDANCGSYWDRYQLLRFDDIFIIWGCVNLGQGLGHEEAVWGVHLFPDIGPIVGSPRTALENLFPIGRIELSHLDMVTHITLPTYATKDNEINCEQLMCKRNPTNPLFVWILVSVILGMFALSYFVYRIGNYKDENRVREFNDSSSRQSHTTTTVA